MTSVKLMVAHPHHTCSSAVLIMLLIWKYICCNIPFSLLYKYVLFVFMMPAILNKNSIIHLFIMLAKFHNHKSYLSYLTFLQVKYNNTYDSALHKPQNLKDSQYM